MGIQIPGLIHLRGKLKTKKKAIFSLLKKEQFPEGAACLLVQVRGEVQHVLQWVGGSAWGGSAALRAGLCHPRTC